MPIVAAGDRALLATFDTITPAELRTRAAAIRRAPDVLVCIVGHSSLLTVFRDAPDAAVLEAAATSIEPEPPRVHQLNVAFDGPDLDEFLATARLSRNDFLAHVADVRLSVRYLGFRAGFAYLDGWPPTWRMPRRATSRTRVPRGCFAIAGEMAGFYPVDSPGGWNLLGRTDAVLWDAEREPPNLLAPGDEVRLRAFGVAAAASAAPRPPEAGEAPAATPIEVIAAGQLTPIEVIAPGQLTTIVAARDWSRAEHGVTPGGPFDELAAAMANRACGNAPDAPLLECVLVGPRLRFASRTRVAIFDGALRVDDVEEIDVGRLRNFRAWIAVAGGLDPQTPRYAEAPRVLRSGSSVAVGLAFGVASTATLIRSSDHSTIRVRRGPHDAPFDDVECDVTPQLDRVGIRLRPRVALPPAPADLPSIGMQFGSVQQHPDGSLVVMGPDHPVTGGYLQPVTVLSSELWKLAQLAPGERVRLVVSE